MFAGMFLISDWPDILEEPTKYWLYYIIITMSACEVCELLWSGEVEKEVNYERAIQKTWYRNPRMWNLRWPDY